MNRIAIKIKEARLKSGMSEKDLAKKCGLTAGYIIQVESGKKIINEKAADKILSALGTKAEMLEETSMREEKANSEKKPVKKAAPVSYSVEPNAQWASALAGVLKKYPIYDCSSGKVVGDKEMPIINKRVEGHQPDRLMYISVSNDELEVLRLLKGDVLTVLQTKEIQNDNLYLVEVSKKKMVRKLRFENNKMRLSNGVKGKDMVLNKKDVEIIGKCLKAEFNL